MQQEFSKEQLPPPSAEEVAVVQSFLHQCTHAVYERGYEGRLPVTVCVRCAASHFIEEGTSDEKIADLWRRSVPRPATHEVVAKAALAEAVRIGWDTSIHARDDQWVCTVKKENRIEHSAPQPTLAKAIVDVLARIAGR